MADMAVVMAIEPGALRMKPSCRMVATTTAGAARIENAIHFSSLYGSDGVYACWMMFRLCLMPLFPYRAELGLD